MATTKERLTTLGITLPAVSPPAAAYVSWKRSGDQVFVAGHIARRDGAPWRGQLGAELATADGAEAARLVAIDLLATLNAACGDLERVRLVKLLVLVNSTPTFTEQPAVANGASQLLVDVLGERGTHARSAFGVTQLPFGSCVEIELVAELERGTDVA